MFEAYIINKSSKLITVEGHCSDINNNIIYNRVISTFNIYKNPQPLLHKIFEISLSLFGSKFINQLNPVEFLKGIK